MVKAKTLVTGATGGLGQVLVQQLLQDGREVVAIGRNPQVGAQLARRGACFVAADIVQGELQPLFERVDSVFHLAALSSPWGPEQEFLAVNLHATQRLLAMAQTAGCQRFIYTSTPSIYTRARDQIGLTEDSPLPERLINAYARTKFAAEILVRQAARPGFETVALRPRAIIGPHDTVLLPRLLRAAAKGVMPLPGHGRALIEPTDARDVVQALLLAEQCAPAVSGQVFNLSGGTALPLAQLASTVFDKLGREVRTIALPAQVALAVAGGLELFASLRGKEPLLTRYSAMVLGWSQTFDLSAVKTALGWSARFTPDQSIDWALQGGDHA